MEQSSTILRQLPFTEAQLREIVDSYPTPFHIYDERGIRRNARRLQAAFSWCPKFREFFAVKANPNPFILEILREEGFGGDCSSLTELMLCEAVGICDESIMFTSNNTPVDEYALARRLGALINLDDFTHIDYLERHVGFPPLISMRFNPGPLRSGNAIIGTPEEAKYGFTREQLLEAYGILHAKGVRRFGLHAMVASNELNADFFVETARMLFQLCIEIHRQHGLDMEFINLGGGIGIPYRPEESAVDLEYVSVGIRQLYDQMIRPAGLHPLNIYMENGRMISGPYGYLVTEAIHEKHTFKEYIGVDACMANLMRPGMYGAYHHITVMGKQDMPHEMRYDVVGSLCENNDKFAINRLLPEIHMGDLLVIHDTGAHGYSMGFQYNGKRRSAELLLQEDGRVKLIRRAETAADYFATLDYPGLPKNGPDSSLRRQ